MHTVGIYSGPSPADRNAELRKLFTVRENQQDGLGSILRYCQTKSGFTVGSSDTTAFQKVLTSEFSSILIPLPSRSSQLELTKPSTGIIALPTAEELRPYFQNSMILEIYIALLMAMGYSYKSIVQFVTKMDSEQLSFDIDESHVFRRDSDTYTLAKRNSWIVNRDEMARQADWLVNKLGLKDSLDDWNQRITSSEFSGLSSVEGVLK
ncbi:hypothetical protein BGW42_003400 [Actinomortierella wolfii]|nr:hypothetical protein BGW42_003400 [Actinomortierella wolfii]